MSGLSFGLTIKIMAYISISITSDRSGLGKGILLDKLSTQLKDLARGMIPCSIATANEKGRAKGHYDVNIIGEPEDICKLVDLYSRT